AILGLGPAAGKSDVKSAYARRLKTCSPETDPEGWMSLHNAYRTMMDFFDGRKNTGTSSSSSSSSSSFRFEQEQEAHKDNDYEDIFREIVQRESETYSAEGVFTEKISSDVSAEISYAAKEDGTIVIIGVKISGHDSSCMWDFSVPEHIDGKTVTEIAGKVFSSCHILRSIAFHEGITSIGAEAFSDCINLTRILLPDTLTKIGYRAFYGCMFLERIYLPEKLTFIADEAFKDCFILHAEIAETNPYAEGCCRLGGITYSVKLSSGRFRVWAYDMSVPTEVSSGWIKDMFTLPNGIPPEMKYTLLNAVPIGEGFTLIDPHKDFTRKEDPRENIYIFEDKISGCLLEVSDFGRKADISDERLIKRILESSPLIPANAHMVQDLTSQNNILWCAYSFNSNFSWQNTELHFVGFIVCNRYVLYIRTLNKRFSGTPAVGGIDRFVKALRSGKLH
ncbi:MAG: leucine-rich repeat domain-containing protein, partial [Synergistaceae bacterium]|nr:leucine-rich repeat domain-containing protein [Synergistaceae bacterium]